MAGCRSKLEDCAQEDASTVVNTGCVLFKEGSYEEARTHFVEATNVLGVQPDLRCAADPIHN